MKSLTVVEHELKPKYKRREFWWNHWFKIFFSKYAETVWGNNALILFPLLTDIAVGDMKYHYYLYGYKNLIHRIRNYHKVMQMRIRGDDVPIDIDQFHVHTLLTDEDSINNQLNKEMFELLSKEGWNVELLADKYKKSRTKVE